MILLFLHGWTTRATVFSCEQSQKTQEVSRRDVRKREAMRERRGGKGEEGEIEDEGGEGMVRWRGGEVERGERWKVEKEMERECEERGRVGEEVEGYGSRWKEVGKRGRGERFVQDPAPF